MPTKDLSLEAYPPHFMTFLKSAAINTTEVPMDSKADAVTTRASIYKMRSTMKDQHHELYPFVSKVVLTLRERDGVWILIGKPNRAIVEAFERAGIKPDLDIGEDILGNYGLEDPQ